MSNCSVCGNKIGFLGETFLTKIDGKDYYVCERCSRTISKSKKKGGEAAEQLKELMAQNTNLNEEIRNYVMDFTDKDYRERATAEEKKYRGNWIMKIVIWIGFLFLFSMVQTAIYMSGVTFGAIATIIYWAFFFWVVRTCCSAWDKHKNGDKQAEETNAMPSAEVSTSHTEVEHDDIK